MSGVIFSTFKFDQDKLVLLDHANKALNVANGTGNFAKTTIWDVHNALPAPLYGEYFRTGTFVRRSSSTTLYKSKDGAYALHDDQGRLHLRFVRSAEYKELILELLTYRAGESSAHPDLRWEVRLTEDWRIVSAVLTDSITFAPVSCKVIDATVLKVPSGVVMVDGRMNSEKPSVVSLGRRFDDADEAIRSVETKSVVRDKSRR